MIKNSKNVGQGKSCKFVNTVKAERSFLERFEGVQTVHLLYSFDPGVTCKKRSEAGHEDSPVNRHYRHRRDTRVRQRWLTIFAWQMLLNIENIIVTQVDIGRVGGVDRRGV